ncbi:hypothetical protein M2440_003938 [Methylorubrum extorquens]|uniref:hypothetical protein n=1 Tax=Methylorubrum extorquens TaxID=408 RepID=UPI00209DE27A|nr:hypothetical protein [Methylorubrum extorquens]MCP1559596.1 hypothetical protein [Methylorubrum extorquens]MDF9793237.1 hypothetical protein [Methylorubrum extorquens]MDF9864940.1 hypothetical protein [Methylorubrum pseudosasae]
MKSARPIALWLAAVIVMIAAALMPSGARAHGAHGQVVGEQDVREQGVREQGVHEHVAQAPDLAMAGSDLRLAGPASIVRADAIPVIEQSRMACACPACAAGGVCGHAPSSCCATGLAPSPVPDLPPAGAQACAPARDGPRLSGIVPEAQIEPPRTLA